jgi:SAM-dependent methyltransferase
MRLSRLAGVTTALIAMLFVSALAQTPAPTTEPKKPDVPYVPTHERIVDRMLTIAKVTRDDVLYDLGSGDGRIVITAAQKYGTHGVGIDIDPERVREANENAQRAGVTDRVRFILGDIFDADIRPATVVTMYLLPEVNLRLLPKLRAELKPGTRIVSHNYDLGDWRPERTAKLTVSGTDHHVYFWIMPPGAARQP